MNGLGGYYTKWHKSDNERQILYDITYVWTLKNKIMSITEKNQIHRYREHSCDTKGKREVIRDKWGVWD